MSETVVLTASPGAFPGLIEALRQIPVTVEERPLMNFAPPADWAPLDRALGRVAEYKSLVFTSPRAAEAFVARIRQLGIALSLDDPFPQVWASGPQTASALAGVIAPVRLPQSAAMGTVGAATAVAEAMLAEQVRGPVLFPCGEEHREELVGKLRSQSLRVDEVVCYRSILAEESEARLAVSRGRVVVVASPRVAGLLARACPGNARPELLAVGPTTAESARAAGWSPSAVAVEPTARALTIAVRSLLARP